MTQTLKARVYNLIREDDDNNLPADIFDGIIIVLIVLNVVFLVLDTFQMPMWFQRVSNIFESACVGIFTVEYLARLWTAPLMHPHMRPAKARLRFVFSLLPILDLFSILPFYIPVIFNSDLRVLRLLRVVRLLRIFKVSRYTHALETIQNVFRKKAGQLLSSLFVLFLLIIIASVLMYSVENRAQPVVFKNALDGLWWALSTVTQADYGDIYPITPLGRLLSAAIALLGIGLIAVPTGIISAGFVEEMPEGNSEDTTGTATQSPAAELLRYKQLLDCGGITAGEYEVKKSELLCLKKDKPLPKQ